MQKSFDKLIANGVAHPVVARAISMAKPVDMGTRLVRKAATKMKGDDGRSIALATLADRDIGAAEGLSAKLVGTGGPETPERQRRGSWGVPVTGSISGCWWSACGLSLRHRAR